MKTFRYCVVIGRFQPYHHGHHVLVQSALDVADNLILALGSCNGRAHLSVKNPWLGPERLEMILPCLTSEQRQRTAYVYQPDFPGDNQEWANFLRRQVNQAIRSLDCDPNFPIEEPKIALLGHEHDASSFYLKLFPEWTLILKDNVNQFPHATVIRQQYFAGSEEWKSCVLQPVATFLDNFKTTERFLNLSKELAR